MSKLNYIGISITIFLSISGCINRKQIATETDSVLIQTVPLQARELSMPIHTAGRISSKEEMKLSFKIGGVIEKIFVQESEKVKKGDILARLNLSEIDGQVNQAKLALEKAKREYTRASDLYADSVATLEQLQNARTMLEAAESNLKVAEFNRQYSVIFAPASGTILRKLASENEITSAGYPVFLFGSIESGWVFRGTATDLEVSVINQGDTAKLTMDAFPQRYFKARVSKIASFADPFTGTYEVELVLASPPAGLTSGMLGSADIYPKKLERYIMIPVDALVEGTERFAFIYIVKDNLPVKRKIKVDKFSGSWIYTRDSIDPGTEIVIVGAAYITSGKKIKIVHQSR